MDVKELARVAAARHGIDPVLVAAVIATESSWDAWSWKPEPAYRYLWDVRLNQPFRKLTLEEQASENPPADFSFIKGSRTQEWWGQQASWGLMQVVGGTAREFGFKGPYLTMLCDPETGIQFGCLKLADCLVRESGVLRKALLRYNGGNDLGYPDRVLKNMAGG